MPIAAKALLSALRYGRCLTSFVIRKCGIAYWSGYDYVRTSLAIVLLIAASLKSYQLLTEPVLGDTLLTSRWFLTAVVEFEILLGVWFLVGLWPRMAWIAAVGCFSSFAVVAFYKGLSGEASCGCFGKVVVNPWYTLTLDTAAVFALLVWRPFSLVPRPVLSEASGRSWAAAFSVLLFVAVVPVAVAVHAPSRSATALGDLFDDGRVVLLRPEKWMGRPFVLLNHIDVGDQLAQGAWRIVLYHHDCPMCRRVVSAYPAKPESDTERNRHPRIAIVEIPPFGEENDMLIPSWMVHGKLTGSVTWIAKTPVEVFVDRGIVVSVSHFQ